jgi:hypothetical protein
MLHVLIFFTFVDDELVVVMMDNIRFIRPFHASVSFVSQQKHFFEQTQLEESFQYFWRADISL